MKKFLPVAAVAVVVVAAASFAVSLFFDADSFRPMLESRLSAAVGRSVTFGHLKLSLLSGGVVADDLTIAEDPAFGSSAFLKAKSVRLRVNVPALLLSRQLHVTAVQIQQPAVTLVQDAAGKWNFSSLGVPASSQPSSSASPQQKGPLELAAEKISITGGRVSVGKKPEIVDEVNLEVENFALGSSFPFTLSAAAFGGEFEAKGKAGPIVTTDASATPVEATFDAKKVDLAKAPTDLGGVVAVDGSFNLAGHIAHLNAHGKAEKLKLVAGASPAAHPVELDCVIDHDIANETGTLTQGDVKTGRALLQFNGPYSFQKNGLMAVKLSVYGQDMPLADLESLMSAVNVSPPSGAAIRGGRASIHLTAEGPVDQLVTSGTVGAADISVTGYDLGAKLSTLERLAGIRTGPTTEIQLFSSAVRSGPGGTSLDNMKLFVTGVGQISGAGTISSSRQLNFKMRANLVSPEAKLVNLARGISAGVPFTVTGTSSNPIFRADVRGIVAQELIPAKRVPAVATDLLRGLLGGKKSK